MNFALIVDKCQVASYYVKNNKAYKFIGHKTEFPYQFHHSVEKDLQSNLYVPIRREKSNLHSDGFAILDQDLNFPV